MLHSREWGVGQPVIAMHPLGLDSSAFEGFGQVLASRGMRTIAVDLPGFGRSPEPDRPLTPAVMAEPVIELARSLPIPPLVLGVSMGGRVALEAALTAPDAFRGVIAIAPSLPWLRFRPLLGLASLVDPRAADWLPLERAWPVLRWLARTLERLPCLREDELAQAGARLVYYLSCPATRASFISAARELALDPPYGELGLWTRLPRITIPMTMVLGRTGPARAAPLLACRRTRVPDGTPAAAPVRGSLDQRTASSVPRRGGRRHRDACGRRRRHPAQASERRAVHQATMPGCGGEGGEVAAP